MKDYVPTPQPFISFEEPGLGGQLKEEPGHFVVEEIPLYEACGQGPHLYVTLRRAGMTTQQVVSELACRFDRPNAEVGYAGLKDKAAVTTQTFSIPVPDTPQEAESLLSGGPWETLKISRHLNKLKPGHLLGNRFVITLSGSSGDLAQAERIAYIIRTRGLPNYFGAQRFGHSGDNVGEGFKMLRSGRRPRGWRGKLMLSAVQSYVYNHYLGRRVKEGLFHQLLEGDVCKKITTGGIFVSTDAKVDGQRLETGEISHTGPLFGRQMMEPTGLAADLETRTLADLDLTREDMAGAGQGDRRLNRVLLPDLRVSQGETGLLFHFSLPKGAYATTVLREFIKGSGISPLPDGLRSAEDKEQSS